MKRRLPSIDFVSLLPRANIALSLLVAAGRSRPKAVILPSTNVWVIQLQS